MRERLNEIRRISGAEYVYTMRKTDDGKFMYVIDGYDSGDSAHIGDTEESDYKYETAWSGEVYVDSSINKEKEWGALFSTYFR